MGDGMRQTLSYSDIRDLAIQMPNEPKEQISIVKYFSRIDILISAQEQKLNKLRSLKKSFLEKMFVNIQN